MNTEQLSMLEVAIEIMKDAKEPRLIMELIGEVLERKGIEDPEGFEATQLYIDITTSSDFVYCGESKWDLKAHQSLDLYDRDGSYFNTGEDLDDEDDKELDINDYNIDEEDSYENDDDDEDSDEEDEEEDNYEDDDDMSLSDDDDDSDEENYLDEQEYNDIMDDYEDMYEDN